MKAVRQGHVQIVNALVENGASLTEKNKGGKTALFIAELYSQPEIVVLLKKAGAQN